jgi:cytochrome c-type biogenesis protein
MTALAEGAAPAPLWRHAAFGLTLSVALLAGALLYAFWPPISDVLFTLEFALAGAFGESWIGEARWLALPAVGFAAGLAASLSPCILPLVPLNVAYIGASHAEGRQALWLSGAFVLGAAGALAVLGLAGDLAGFLLIDQRGPVLLGAGAALLYLGLAALELAPLPLLSGGSGGGRRLSAAGAGAAFSLVTTPCASPLLGAVLAAAASQSVPGLSAVSMVGFALGYTALVFVAGAFGGKLVERLRGRSFEAPRAASAALLLVAGAGFLLSGIDWLT